MGGAHTNEWAKQADLRHGQELTAAVVAVAGMAEVMGGLRSDTEERYAALKARLKAADIGASRAHSLG